MKYFGLLLGAFLMAGLSFSFDLADSLVVSEHQGIVELPAAHFSTDSITSFDLFIKDAHDFIFHDPQTVFIQNLPASGVLSSDNKKITFVGAFSGDIVVSGLKIRSYSRDIRDARIGLILGEDKFYSTNYIDQVRDGRNWDRMEPLPVKNVDYVISGSSLLISWQPSPDLDVVRTSLQIYKDGNYYKFIELSSLSSGYTIDLSSLIDSDIQIDVAAWDIYYSSPVVTIDISTIDSPLADEVVYYQPTIDNKLLLAIATRLDANLSTLGKADQTHIEQRNGFILFLEKFFLRQLSIENLVTGLNEYGSMLSILRY